MTRRICSPTQAAQLLARGLPASVRRRHEVYPMTPIQRVDNPPRGSWSGHALIRLDGLPIVVAIHRIEPGVQLLATVPQPAGSRWQRHHWLNQAVPWANVLGLSARLRSSSFVVG